MGFIWLLMFVGWITEGTECLEVFLVPFLTCIWRDAIFRIFIPFVVSNEAMEISDGHRFLHVWCW